MVSSRRDRVRVEAARLLNAGASGHVFPGGTACVSYRSRDGSLEFVDAAGGLVQPQGKPAQPETIYDLASLTKPVFATLCLRLVERGLLTLESRADQFLADARGTPGGAATLEQLLTHRAGLAAWGGLYLDVPHDLGSISARRWIFSEAVRRPDETPGPPRVIYSDLGYIIAAELVARAVNKELPALIRKEIGEALDLSALDLCFPPALPTDQHNELIRRVAPTERDEWRGRMVRGEVHDENCAALGGISGHAGLFGTARAMCRLGRAVLDAYTGKGREPGILAQSTMAHALAARPGGTHRLGWDGKSATESSAGRRMSRETFGHLGFTGTSIWCDPVHDVVIVLLTNRVCPSRANEKIKGFRPAFHDALMALVDGA